MKLEGAERTWAEFGALSQLDEAAIQPFQLGAALLGGVRDIVLGEGRCGHFRGGGLHKCREVEAGDAVNGAAPRALGAAPSLRRSTLRGHRHVRLPRQEVGHAGGAGGHRWGNGCPSARWAVWCVRRPSSTGVVVATRGGPWCCGLVSARCCLPLTALVARLRRPLRPKPRGTTPKARLADTSRAFLLPLIAVRGERG